MSRVLALAGLVAGLAVALGADPAPGFARGAAAAAGGTAPRVVVLGFDGADAAITEQLLAEGRLPHLAALAAEGGYRPLLPTNPPQTPVSWSTFATGLNPGRTEIFDFIKRQGRSYLPTLCAFDETGRRPFLWGRWNGAVFAGLAALVGVVPLAFLKLAQRRLRRRLLGLAAFLAVTFAAAGFGFGSRLLPESVPRPVNNRKGVTFWEHAAAAGLSARILRVPVTFPADRFSDLSMLSGLGVPDMRGLNGQPTLYTTRSGLSGGRFSVQVVAIPDPSAGPVEARIDGPRNLLFPPRDGSRPERLQVPIRLTVVDGDRVRVAAGDRVSELAAGEWSDWHVLRFRFNLLLSAKGMVRFHASSPEAAAGRSEGAPAPPTDVLMSPIHFHPDAGAMVSFCHPGDYARRLAGRIGLFKTMGWAIDTWSVSDGLADEEHSLQDALYTAEKYTQLMRHELSRGGTDLHVQVFAFPDRIQHVFWRLRDPQHPGHDKALAARHEGVVEAAYERMDAIVGEARRLLPPETTFIVLSDHGFASFRRGVNLNRWLVEHGFMVLRRDPCQEGQGGERSLDDLFEDRSGVFSEVDWTRTRAYAMGLGNVYVNLAGREPRGIVRPGAEYQALVAELTRGLEALVDPQTGDQPVRRVHHRDDSYSGYDPELVPDLRVANAPGYRVSWDTVLGGVPCEVVVDNLSAWSGDHCSMEPEDVPGILFASRPLVGTGADMIDMAPSILHALGLPVPEAMEGRSLF